MTDCYKLLNWSCWLLSVAPLAADLMLQQLTVQFHRLTGPAAQVWMSSGNDDDTNINVLHN